MNNKAVKDLMLIAFATIVALHCLSTVLFGAPARTQQTESVSQESSSNTNNKSDGTDETSNTEDTTDKTDETSTTDDPATSDSPSANASKNQDREMYVSTWAERIDAFNEGYPLEGHGRTFAEAAYDYGVDPRYSPAIARVESSSGEHCFLSHNAWGWGDVEWPDWDTAIREHVAGLAENYGYTLSYHDAEVYNQVYVDQWYSMVDSCMQEIWPSDEL